MTVQMPKRAHYLKFQCSIPINKTKASVAAFNRVVNEAANHLKAVAGGAAFNVEVRAVYQDRGPGKTGIVWRDILVICGFDGPLTFEAKKLSLERADFEFDKANNRKTASALSLGGETKPPGKILLS